LLIQSRPAFDRSKAPSGAAARGAIIRAAKYMWRYRWQAALPYIFLLVAIVTILIEGAAISLNKCQCPLTTLAEKHGAEKGSVADIFMPGIIARNLFKWSPSIFAGELILLGFRYLTG